MRFEVETLDDALLKLYPELLALDSPVKASRGDFVEMLGVLIEIRHPRARLSRSETRGKPFSCLGELLWYLSGQNRLEFIEHYIPEYRHESDDGATIHGGYGPRLFQQRGLNQLHNVISLLRKRPTTRQAVIQIFNAEDIATKHKDVPCTTTLQFFIREDRVQLIATMRSNDAFIGLPHDVFCFTMLQEIVARSLDRDIGTYRHFVGSMHLYERHRGPAQNLVEEGYQARIEMPAMPVGDPWPAIRVVLTAEERPRTGEIFDANFANIDPYWLDLIRLLQIFFSRDVSRIEALGENMSVERYRPYIVGRLLKVRDAH